MVAKTAAQTVASLAGSKAEMRAAKLEVYLAVQWVVRLATLMVYYSVACLAVPWVALKAVHWAESMAAQKVVLLVVHSAA